MGGRSSSAVSNQTDNSSRVADQSGNSGIAISATDAATVTFTDLGAIDKATALAGGAVDSALKFGAESLFFADKQAERAGAMTSDAMASVGNLASASLAANERTLKQVGALAGEFRSDGKTTEQKNMLIIGGGALIAVVVVVAVVSYSGSKKK